MWVQQTRVNINQFLSILFLSIVDRICNVPGDIVFVIDGSDSISDEDFVRLKNFVANLIDNFEIGPDAIHVGMIVFSTLVGETIG